VDNAFMRSVRDDGEWSLYWRTEKVKAARDGRRPKPWKTLKARKLWDDIALAAWSCADPGVQFDTTINDWHTCPNTARINASNPCSEYMFLDDTACNLSSINLMKFVKPEGEPKDAGEFDVVGFEKACRTMIVAQEILVDNASYPTPAIEKNSHAYRPLGLGYANLGALLMSRGLPYDSDAGRDYAGTITAIMHGAAFAESSRVARDHGGPFSGYEKNKEPMMRVMRKHRAALKDIDKTNVPKDLFATAKQIWDECIELGEQHGYRNAQTSLLAPTGDPTTSTNPFLNILN
jgi:ribonucleoside-diphosphate reductase alpha chain